MYIYYIWSAGYVIQIGERHDLIDRRSYENESVWMIPGTINPTEE